MKTKFFEQFKVINEVEESCRFNYKKKDLTLTFTLRRTAENLIDFLELMVMAEKDIRKILEKIKKEKEQYDSAI